MQPDYPYGPGPFKIQHTPISIGICNYMSSHTRETYVRTPALIEPINQEKTILIDSRRIVMVMRIMSNVSSNMSILVRSHVRIYEAGPICFQTQPVAVCENSIF